ncbi:hypothetical protein INT43_004350 [Umbelopsis isabellina]|uniref:CBM21 domain-containing protein n=1 Tax=Mortierella isabellina TaxID=91625 RepID=A0A8H7PHY3_MORIS|nr:hypothetical protein INT43_004350 [Umbelopsis isabellina]
MPYTASQTLVINASSPSSKSLNTALPKQWTSNRRVSLKKNSLLNNRTLENAQEVCPLQDSVSPVKSSRTQQPGTGKLHLNLQSCTTPMIRKKSGEIVKSSLRCKSAPSTPTCPKFVHFNAELEHVRLFLKGQTPTSVHNDPQLPEDDENSSSSTDKDQLIMKLPNWPVLISPIEMLAKMVALESIQLAADQKSLIGRCQVSNISFKKQVIVRYTTNYWQDTHEVEASYREPCASGDASNSALDRFMFNIPIDPTINQNIFACVRYVVNGREFWDNNGGRNYRIDLYKPVTKPTIRQRVVSDELPIKRRTKAMDDTGLEFGTSPPNPITLAINENKSKLWDRYDFGASLSAAKKTTSPKYHRVQSYPSYFNDTPEVEDMIKPYQKNSNTTTPPIAIPRPQRPAPDSSSYFDLVNKYCFYGNESSIYSTSPSYSCSPAIRG